MAETRSFVAAGRLLGVSASAVGKSMARLEDRLGVRLLHRSTRSVTLTAEGTLFLERSRRILAEIEAAELELRQATDAPRGRAPSEPESMIPTSMICNNIEARLCFALQGLGIAFLPDFSIRKALADGQLCPVLADHLDWEGTFNVLWPASKHPSPKVRALVDFLCARVFPADTVAKPPRRATTVRGTHQQSG